MSVLETDCVADTTQKRCHVDTAVLIVAAESVKTLLKAYCLTTDSLCWRLSACVLEDGRRRHGLVLL